jgi:hypothetical protein
MIMVKALIPYNFPYRRSYYVACINITLTSRVFQRRRDCLYLQIREQTPSLISTLAELIHIQISQDF